MEPQNTHTFTNSRNVRRFQYDPEKKTLVITFTNGSMYKYFDVPQTVYIEGCSASSVGQYVASNIKGVYQFEKI